MILAPSFSNIDSDDLINVQDNFYLQEDGSFMPFNIDDAIIPDYEDVEIAMAEIEAGVFEPGVRGRGQGRPGPTFFAGAGA